MCFYSNSKHPILILSKPYHTRVFYDKPPSKLEGVDQGKKLLIKTRYTTLTFQSSTSLIDIAKNYLALRVYASLQNK